MGDNLTNSIIPEDPKLGDGEKIEERLKKRNENAFRRTITDIKVDSKPIFTKPKPPVKKIIDAEIPDTLLNNKRKAPDEIMSYLREQEKFKNKYKKSNSSDDDFGGDDDDM